MNGSKYVDLLETKLLLHKSIHNTSIFMQDGAPSMSPFQDCKKNIWGEQCGDLGLARQ